MNKEKSWKALYESNDKNSNTSKNSNAKVELSISARNLLNLDTFSKSDSQCIVYLKESKREEYREIGKTEMIKDNLNPDFVTKIVLDYNFEKIQYLKFEFWDIDLSENDFLGNVETTLPEIIANKNKQFIRQITGIENKNCGDLIIVVEELSTCKQNLFIKLRAIDVNKNHFFKPNPFIQIWRSNEDGSFTIVHKTNVIISTKKPNWPEMQLKIKTLCNADFERNIKIELLDYKTNGNHKTIGAVYTSLNQLLDLEKEGNTYEIRNEKKKKTKGTLIVENTKLANTYSFFDYVRSGMEIHFAVAIDFTQSNGNTTDPSSLHYIDSSNAKPNLYEIAIKSVGNIIQYYNSTHQFAGFGFGASIPPDFKISHCFPLNNNNHHPYCEGVDDLLFHYKKTIQNVKLSGPTNFAPIIDYTASIAFKNLEKNSYFILLIITDGSICDMPQTIRSIIRSAKLPLSIIIIGIGNTNFDAMDQLDADDGPLELNGKKCERDIVQFVRLNKYIKDNNLVNNVELQMELAKEVLFEVPDQVVAYMEMHQIKPLAN